MEISNVEIPIIVVGIVQVVEQLFDNLSSKGKLVIALVIGIILLSLGEALPYMGETAGLVVMSIVRVLGYAIAIPGWFSVVTDDILAR